MRNTVKTSAANNGATSFDAFHDAADAYSPDNDNGGDDEFAMFLDSIGGYEALQEFWNVVDQWRDGKITVAMGALDKDDPKTSKYWDNATYTRRQWQDHLMRVEKGKKAGKAILQGSVISLDGRGVQRLADNMCTMQFVGLDVDNGADVEAIKSRIRELGLDVVIQETHSSRKPHSAVTTKDLMTWANKNAKGRWQSLGTNDEGTDQQIRAYFAEAKGYLPYIMESVTGTKRVQREYVMEHTPFMRVRVFVFLWKPFVASDADRFITPAAAQAEWKRIYAAVAKLIGIENYDQSCTDISRLYYLTRCPLDRPDTLTWHNEGVPLVMGLLQDFMTAEKVSARNAVAVREAPRQALPGVGAASGFNEAELRKGLHRNRATVRAGDFVIDYFPDGAAKGAGATASSPFAHLHSPGGATTDAIFAVNAIGSTHNHYSVKDVHAGCKDFKSADFIVEMCRQLGIGWDVVRQYVDEDAVSAGGENVGKNGRELLYTDVTAETEFALGAEGRLNGRPLPTERNLMIALKRLGIRVRKNEFRNLDLIDGYQGFDQILNDETMTALRLQVARDYDLSIGKEQFYDFIEAFGLHDAFHPVRDYLDEVEATWDGMARVESLASRYFGGEDTPLSRAMSKCFMIAAVRRIRKPGTKHDVALVFESETQGWGKSSGIQALAVRTEYFTDDLPVGSDSKEVIEKTRGIWIAELAELAGMGRKEVETVKSFLSRQVDTARGAYGRIPERVSRSFVCVGSTNSTKYLKDGTGNRRFWPVRCVREVDVAAIIADREKLWAEAATLERQGVTHVLDSKLWAVAGAEQNDRAVDNPYFDALEAALPLGDYWITRVDVYAILDVKPTNQHDGVQDGVRRAMERLGFEHKKEVRTKDGKRVRGFRRGVDEAVAVVHRDSETKKTSVRREAPTVLNGWTT